MKDNIFLAIDPSLSSTGYAIFDGNKKPILINRVCTTNKLNEDKRIFKIVDELIALSISYCINDVVIEEQFFKENRKTAMQLSRLRGAIAYAFGKKNINVHYIQPTVVKKYVTGKGNSSKLEVAQCIIDKLGKSKIVKNIGPFSDRAGNKKTSDMYDALAIGYAFMVDMNEKK